MTIRTLSRDNVVLVFLALNFIAIAFTLTTININNQRATEQRTAFQNLTITILKTDSHHQNETLDDLERHLNEDKMIHQRQSAILDNQKRILTANNIIIKQIQKNNLTDFANRQIEEMKTESQILAKLNQLNSTQAH